MKCLIFVTLIIFTTILCQNSYVCKRGINCPIGKGFCQNGNCICKNDYYTLISPNQKIIYCSYEKINRFYPLLLELFLPSIGHFYVGKYYFGIIKLSLIVIPLICFIYGYFLYKKHIEENNQIENNKVGTTEEKFFSRADNEQIDNKHGEDELHVANREKHKLNYIAYFPVLVTFICAIIFFPMHIFDLFCYFLGYYNDGYGVPLI